MKSKTDWEHVFAIIGVVVLIVIFYGDPDLHDALISRLMAKEE